MRIEFRFIPVGLQRDESIKVEFNLNEQAFLYPLVDVGFTVLDDEGELYTANARSYDINEMLGTKTRAPMQRRQGRDLFKLWYARQQSCSGLIPYNVDAVQTMRAFEFYLAHEGVTIGQNEATTLLDDRLSDPRFCRDMDTLLRPGLPAFDPIMAGQVIREKIITELSR